MLSCNIYYLKGIIKSVLRPILRNIFRIFWIFPIKKRQVVFETFEGKNIICNPYYIYNYMQDNFTNFKYIWISNSKFGTKVRNIKYVTPNSFNYYFLLLVSKVYITNGFPKTYLPFRKKQIVISTWHGGGAYKRVDMLFPTARLNNSLNYILSSCLEFEKAFHSSLMIDYEKFLPYGMPRNDIFFDTKKCLIEKQKIIKELNINSKSFIVLYAPTFRELYNGTKKPKLNFSLDVDSLRKAIGKRFNIQDVIILFRSHSVFINNSNLIEYESSISNSSRLIDVSLHPDVQSLLCASDLLISDYSSIIWDYTFTGKPCFLFVPDLDNYKDSRNFYIPIEKWGFPMARTNLDLCHKIETFNSSNYKKILEQHHKLLGSYENGTATKRFCDFLINKMEK